MKRILGILLLTASAFANTTVTGTVQTLGTVAVPSGSYVRFWLRGCGGNNPRVSGSGIIAPTQGGVYYFDFPVNGSGQISGTLYSTRNAAGTGNGEIECGGSLTAVWYGMQVFTGGKGGPEVAVHAKSGASLDVSSVTPITTNPTILAPTGDSTYLRLDAGNSPVTGLATFNAGLATTTATATNAGVFTNAQMNLYVQALINSCSPLTEFSNIFTPPSKSTEALTGCIVVPNTATVFQTNSVGAYVENQNGATTAGVAVFGLAQATGQANGRIWGANFLATDITGLASGSLYSAENDCNLFNVSSVCHGLLITGFWKAQPSVSMGIEIAPPQQGTGCTNCVWPYGIRFDTAATTTPNSNNAAVGFFPITSAANQNSQGMFFLSNAPVSGQAGTAVYETPAGDLTIVQGASQGLLAPIYKSQSANIAQSGQFRVASSDSFVWRNNANSGDLAIAKNASDQLTFNSQVVTATIASGTAVMTTGAILAGTCGSVVTVAATGALTTDVVNEAYSAAVSSNPGVLITNKWVTANNVNFVYCNPTAGSITPNAATLNWQVTR